MDYKVDKARLVQRIIIVSWVTLGLCFIVKIFGGNFFEIMCQSENYKALCEYADTHLWLDIIISVLSSMLCESLYLLAILQKYKFSIKELILTTICVISSSLIKIFFENFSFIADILLLFVLPILFLGKQYKKYYQILVAFVLTLLFQVLSLLIRNLGFINVSDEYFVGLIYSIDVYIMSLLYYLYRNYKKERNDMGKLWVLFMGKPADKLRAMKEKREAQVAKLNEEIKAIETELARQEKEKK